METLLISFLLGGAAFAGDEASPKPPPPPAVDFSALPETASQRKKGGDGKPHPVHARLLLDKTAAAPGETVRVALHLEQDEGWHTYWKSPGSIGQPTDITWTAPDGVTISEHEYPIPQRFAQKGEISFGYEDQVVLISELTVPEDAAPGSQRLAAEAQWLVCKTECIPGSAELELPLVVSDDGAPSAYAAVIDHFEAQHPGDPLAATTLGWDFALDVAPVPADGKFTAAFLLTPTDGATFEPIPNDGIWPTFTPITAVDWSWGLLDEPTIEALDDGRLLVTMKGEAYEPDPVPEDASIGGLIQLKTSKGWVRTELSAALPMTAAGTEAVATNSPLLALGSAATPATTATAAAGTPFVAAATAEAAGGAQGLVGVLVNLLMAFIGGLILNVMPCVLPVLTLKLYGLIEQTDITAKEQRSAGMAYTGGILASFLGLAAVILMLKMVLGIQVDWGFQFQYPPYVAALATIVFVFGLSLFGVFEIPAIGVGAAADASDKEGLAGYFLTGVFATLLATPCSAPFLGPAIAYAFSAPPVIMLAIFALVGFGLAFPFLLIAFVPALYQFLPKPGPWMETFKQLLGFTLIATAVWLTDVLMAQIGADRTTGFLAFLMFCAMGAWIFGHFGGVAATGRRQLTAALVAGGVMLGAGMYFLDMEFADEAPDNGELATHLDYSHEIPWQPFSEDRVAALAGTPIFMDFTADWCLTCKVNERTILETNAVRTAMADAGVVALKADWTRRNDVITEWLHRYGRAGVPMYVVMSPDQSKPPQVLPEVITPGMVIEAIAKATQ